jgi:ABC-type uncharacterized transport system substrate-binding protein
MGAVRLAASSFGMELTPIGINDADEIERGVTAFARASNGGLIVTGNTLTMVHRELIITLAARHRLPAVYALPLFASNGGLISYGPDSIDPCRRAAGYVDRILKGEKPADLPVRQPTKFELVVNLKAAKALGLQIPDKLIALAAPTPNAGGRYAEKIPANGSPAARASAMAAASRLANSGCSRSMARSGPCRVMVYPGVAVAIR